MEYKSIHPPPPSCQMMQSGNICQFLKCVPCGPATQSSRNTGTNAQMHDLRNLMQLIREKIKSLNVFQWDLINRGTFITWILYAIKKNDVIMMPFKWHDHKLVNEEYQNKKNGWLKKYVVSRKMLFSSRKFGRRYDRAMIIYEGRIT